MQLRPDDVLKFYGDLEPIAAKVLEIEGNTATEAISASIAVSLKRIADALRDEDPFKDFKTL